MPDDLKPIIKSHMTVDFKSGCIIMKTDSAEAVATTILETQEPSIMDALCALGWSPPRQAAQRRYRNPHQG